MASSHNISPQQAHEWLASGDAVLIDVREPDEFKAEHIAYAASLPLANVCDLFQKLQIPSGRKIIFHCLRGKRGEQACALIPKNDMAGAVYNIEGGIDAWKNAGLPVVSSGGSRLSIFRQVQITVGSLVLAATLIGFSGHIWGFAVAGLFGAALALSGITGWCGMAMLLSKAPWNK